VEVRPLRIPIARRARLLPLGAQVLPGMRRYAYGGVRELAAHYYARVIAPLIMPAARPSDVIHVLGSDYLPAAAVSAAHRANIPAVITPLAHAGGWGDDPGSAATYRAADAVVALLDVEGEQYRSLGVAPGRIVTCGICSPGVPEANGAELRRRHGIDGPLILFLGVRRDYKGVDVLLAAARLVASERGDAVFAFVGPGPRIADETAGARIIDAGEVDDQARAEWLAAADLLCLPSASEIFPVSFLEAWSARTPVVTTAIPALTELMSRSGGGVAVPRTPDAVAGAILGLIADDRRRTALGEAGFAYWSGELSVEAVARRHEQLYERTLAERL
jgi:glycosyltransferase involved in cell wall biosynthesis